MWLAAHPAIVKALRRTSPTVLSQILLTGNERKESGRSSEDMQALHRFQVGTKLGGS